MLTALINEIEWSEVNREHIDSLMYFFCLQYVEGSSYTNAETTCFIEPLLKLWHKGQSLAQFVNNSNTHRLFASVLIHNCFKGQYELQPSFEINSGILGLLVYLCEHKSINVIDPQLLVQSMRLIEVKPPLMSVLLRLKTCLASFDKINEKSPFFTTISTALNALEGQASHTVFANLTQTARQTLASGASFFSVPLSEQEKKLAQILSLNDMSQLSQWIYEMETTQHNTVLLKYTNV